MLIFILFSEASFEIKITTIKIEEGLIILMTRNTCTLVIWFDVDDNDYDDDYDNDDDDNNDDDDDENGFDEKEDLSIGLSASALSFVSFTFVYNHNNDHENYDDYDHDYDDDDDCPWLVSPWVIIITMIMTFVRILIDVQHYEENYKYDQIVRLIMIIMKITVLTRTRMKMISWIRMIGDIMLREMPIE